jgi:tripartite-type tricarboxylate transporter receptor subunit TctC
LHAQNYPSRSLQLLVPFGAGSAGDITARAVAQAMSQSMGQPVVVDNRPGAGGVVATELAAKSEPNGYTLILFSNTQAITAVTMNKLPYDTVRDFAMVSTIGAFSFGVLVAPESPFKTIKDLIDYARANPGKLNIGTNSVGTTQNLSAELLKSMAGIDVVIVPFNGSGPVLTALKGRQIDAAIENLAPVVGQVKGGSLRALAVTTAERYTLLPDVPTLAESGLPQYDVKSWNGIAVTAKTPQPIVERLNREVRAAVRSPEIQKRFAELGVVPMDGTPEAMKTLLVNEIAKWKAVVDTAKIPRQ